MSYDEPQSNIETPPLTGADLFVYKLYCVDSNITDMYIGLATNIDEQKKRHEEKAHNTDIYSESVTDYVIEHGGWENWIIESIDEPEEIYNQTNDTSRIEKLTDFPTLDELVRRNNEFQQTNPP